MNRQFWRNGCAQANKTQLCSSEDNPAVPTPTDKVSMPNAGSACSSFLERHCLMQQLVFVDTLGIYSLPGACSRRTCSTVRC